MVYDPKTGQTKVYPIPVPHDGINSITPDESRGVEDMVIDGRPTSPVERTLLSSATLDAALIFKRDGGKVLPTPFLMVSYPPELTWRPPEELRGKPAGR